MSVTVTVATTMQHGAPHYGQTKGVYRGERDNVKEGGCAMMGALGTSLVVHQDRRAS